MNVPSGMILRLYLCNICSLMGRKGSVLLHAFFDVYVATWRGRGPNVLEFFLFCFEETVWNTEDEIAEAAVKTTSAPTYFKSSPINL